VLLYELLVGVPPFDDKELFKAGFVEILRVIREVDPPKPSTRFHSIGNADTEISKKRNTGTVEMLRQLKGDLEWIVMKAIEKDKRRRYSSAADLGEDINRFLAQRPIQARPQSLSYTIYKFVRRHKTACSAAILFLLLIIASYGWNILERQKAVRLSREVSYNVAVALKEKAKASAENNQWQLVKLFGVNSLLYQKMAQKEIPMGDLELPFGERDWILKTSLNLKEPLPFWISSDCRHVVLSTESSGTYRVLRIPEGTEILTFNGNEPSREAICFSADGRLLAAEGPGKAIKIWDLNTRDSVRTWKETGSVELMSFSPNEKYIISCEVKEPSAWFPGVSDPSTMHSGGWELRVRNIADGKVEKVMPIPEESRGSSMDLSPSGEYLTINLESFNDISVIDVSKCKIIDTLNVRKLGDIYSHSGKYMAISSRANEITLLESSSRKKLLSFKDHDDIITFLCFSSDDKYLASGGRDNSIVVYDLENGYKSFTLRGHQGSITSLDFSHDNKYLVSGSQDRTVKIWDVLTRNEISSLLGHDKQDISARFSPDDHSIISYCSNKINVWELPRNQPAPIFRGHTDKVTSVQFSPIGQYVASASLDKTIRIWDYSSGQTISVIRGHEEGVNSIDFSPDGKYLASCSKNEPVKMWDTETGREMSRLSRPEETEVLTVRFGLDGRSLVCRHRDGFSSFWVLQSGLWKWKMGFLPRWDQSAQKASWNEKLPFDYYPEHNLLAYSYGNDIEAVRFSAPMGDLDLYWMIHTLGAWRQKIEIGQEFMKREESGKPGGENAPRIIVEEIRTLSGHSGSITSISISPDGKHLASGSNDKSIKIWELSSGREIVTLKGHSDIVSSVDFSSDGNYLVSGSCDNTVLVWKIKALMDYLWLGLEYPYNEKDISNLLSSIEKQTGLRLKNMMPIDATQLYSGMSTIK
jgi:WD40 repeat protein